MTDAIVLTIPRVLHSANVGRGRHWASRHKDTKLWEAEIWIAVAQTTGGRTWLLTPPTKERRRVTITRHKPTRDIHRTDPDNLMFAGKGIRDALKRLRLITDDRAQWLESTVETTYTPGAPAHTTITIERLTERTD